MSTTFERRDLAHHLAVTLFAAVALASGAYLLAACGSESAAGPTFERDASAPDDASPGTTLQCRRTEDCLAHNHICIFDAGATSGHCEPPRDGGSYTPTCEAAIDNASCYPGAHPQ